jgi:ABC-type branched-subunit amino acid transport system permease subunit
LTSRPVACRCPDGPAQILDIPPWRRARYLAAAGFPAAAERTALLANNTVFISPAGMYWTRSGELMVMVVFGGMGSLFGPVLGTIVFLLLEEVLSQFTEYWALIMGPLLLLIVLFARGGIDGFLKGNRQQGTHHG